MKKKSKKNKNINQESFYFEDYIETNKKNKKNKKLNNFQDRIYLLFFLFLINLYFFNQNYSYFFKSRRLQFRKTKN